MSAGRTNELSANTPVKSHLRVQLPKLSPGQKLPRRTGRRVSVVATGASNGTVTLSANLVAMCVCVFINRLSLFGRRNHGGTLNFNARRDFGVRQHGEIGERAFKEATEREPDLRCAKNERLLSVSQ